MEVDGVDFDFVVVVMVDVVESDYSLFFLRMMMRKMVLLISLIRIDIMFCV